MTRAQEKPQSLTTLVVLYWALIGSAVWFAYLNIQPYEKAVTFLSGKVMSQSLLQIVAYIPIINGIASVFAKSINWILGAVLWGVIQIIEVLPLVLYSHDKFIENIIATADHRTKYAEKENDDPALKMLKRAYNRLPTSVVSNLETLKIFTYTIDFLICITVYSPIASGKFSDFFFAIATGQWNKLDYGNLALALITLFAIEVIISLIIWVGKLNTAIKEASR